MAREILTDEDVELEIERLVESDAVKLAQKEHRYKYRRRTYLYNLRALEKRGKELMKLGMTLEDFNFEDLETEDEE